MFRKLKKNNHPLRTVYLDLYGAPQHQNIALPAYRALIILMFAEVIGASFILSFQSID